MASGGELVAHRPAEPSPRRRDAGRLRRAGERRRARRGCGRAGPPARRCCPSVSSRSSSRLAPSSAQASTSSIVSPYLRVSAVSAARRSETRGEPGGVGLEAGGVRRDVAGEVDEQVAQLGEPVGELAGRRVVVADAVERLPRRAGRGQGVGCALLAGERLAGRLGGGAQRVGEPEARLLGGQLGVLARAAGRPPRPRRGRTAAGRPPGRAPAREPTTSASVRSVADQLGPQAGVRRRGGGQRLAAEPVEGGTLGAGPEQAVLVGLAVDRHERLGDLGQRRHRHRRAADPGARAPLRGDVAGEDDLVLLDLTAGVLHGRRGSRRGRRRRRPPRRGPAWRPSARRPGRPGRRAAARARSRPSSCRRRSRP